MAYINCTPGSTQIKVWIDDLDPGYSYDGRVAFVQLYETGNESPIAISRIDIPADESYSSSHTFDFLDPLTDYYMEAWIENVQGMGDVLLSGIDVTTTSLPSVSVERQSDNPFMANAEIWCSEGDRQWCHLVIFGAKEFGQDMDDGSGSLDFHNSFPLHWHLENPYDDDSVTGVISFALRDTGAHQIAIAEDEDGRNCLAKCNIEPIYNPSTIDESIADIDGKITWTISNLACDWSGSGYVRFYLNGDFDSILSVEPGSYNASVSTYFYGDNLDTIQLKAEVYNNDNIVNVIGPVTYTFPPFPSATILVSRADNNPNNIYLTINNVESYHDIARIEILTKLAGLISYQTIWTITNPTTYPINLTFYQMGTAKRRFYARITNVHGGRFTSNYASVLFVPWEWPEQEYMLLTEGGATRDFRHSVWNDLVNRMSEAHLVATRSEWNNEDGYASYDDTLMTDTEEGRTLTALRYNSLKHQIDHNYSTGIEDVETGDPVSGQDHFINLTDKFNQWITTVLDKKN